MEIQFDATSARFDPLDDRWLSQVTQLVADLREVGDVRRRATPVPGAKGDLGTLIMSLGSAGALTAVVEVIKAFVGRDTGRSVRLTWNGGGGLESFEITGAGVDDAVVDRVVRVLESGADGAGGRR